MPVAQMPATAVERLENIFSCYEAGQIPEILHDWFHLYLQNCTKDQTPPDERILIIYDQLHHLFQLPPITVQA